jgi:hypothetical protein
MVIFDGVEDSIAEVDAEDGFGEAFALFTDPDEEV